MRTKRILGRCITLAMVMVLMAAGAAFAGVGGSDVPTVPQHVEVGETGIPFSFTITNQSTTPNQVNNMNLTQFFFVTTCGSALTPGIGCLPGDQEAPNTIVINPLTGTGVAGACIGLTFNVVPTANPNEYEFVPISPIVIGPSNGSGISSECEVAFTVDVLASPTKDALPGTNGLQTAQLARVTMTDAATAETGFAAGSSTVNVFEHCLHVVKDCTNAPACDGSIGISVTATNCGTEGLVNLVVTDDQAGALTCGATTLAAGASTTCTGSYSNVPGSYTDTITASAVSEISQQTVLPDETSVLSDTCDIPPPPSVTATKTCTSPDLACGSTSATFNIHVCNDGTADWTGSITDADCGINAQAIALAAGACTDISCTVNGAAPAIVNSGGSVSVSANGCNDSATINSASCNVQECTCQIQITKTVALDDNCDGVADGPFVNDVTQDAGECVVYQICVTNTGQQSIDNVTVTDPKLVLADNDFGTLTPGQELCNTVPFEIPSQTCTLGSGSTPFCECEEVVGTNTVSVATAVCSVTQTNACDQSGSVCSDTANVACVSEAICRTPGFWGTHAGTADNKKNSQNITQAVIDACGGCLDVCGEIITNTQLDSANSAIEAICVSPSGDIRHQLARQLTSMALNCCMSGFGSDCLFDSSLSELYNSCNVTCASGDDSAQITECVERIDCFNNGGVILENDGLFCQTGACANGDPCNSETPCVDASVCTPLPGNCHDRELCNESVGLCFDPPGPAGSSTACNIAIGDGKGKNAGNDCAVLPKASSDACSKFNQGEECCSSDVEGSCEACAHDICTTNGALSASCDPCVALVCASDAFCCDVQWDSTCVSEVGTICGTPCAGAAGVSAERSR